MKKFLVWIVALIMIAGMLLLVACGSQTEEEKTYSLKTEENGMEVTYTIAFKTNGKVVLTKISPQESLTYEGKYESKGENEYEISISSTSGDGVVPASLSKMRINVDGNTFSFARSMSVDSTSKSTEESSKPAIQTDDSGNYNEKPSSQTNSDQGSNEQSGDTTIKPADPVTAPCNHPASEIVTEATVEPSCKADGHTGRIYCKKCGTTLQQETVLPKTDHPQEAIVTEQTVEPTCTQEGHTGKTYCTVCKTVLIPESILSTIDHNIVDKRCTMCHDVFPYATYTKESIISNVDEGNGNTERKTETFALILSSDSTYILKKTETYDQNLVVSAEKDGEYTRVMFSVSGEEIDALEVNGYDVADGRPYTYTKITSENGIVTTETIVLQEPDYEYETTLSGIYTKTASKETTEKRGKYSFRATDSANIVTADGKRYTIDLERETFEMVEGEEKVNKFQYKDAEIVLYYGDYDDVTMDTLAEHLLQTKKEELVGDGYTIGWLKDGLPTSTIDEPTSPFSLDSDHVYTMEITPDEGNVMVNVIDSEMTYLYFARKDDADSCTTAEAYSALLSLSDEYAYAMGEQQYVLLRMPKAVSVVYALATPVEIEKHVGETYSVEEYSGYTTWYTENDEYTEGDTIELTGSITLYPSRYSVTYYKDSAFITETFMTKPDVTGSEMVGYTNMGFKLDGVSIGLADLPGAGDWTVLCYYENKSVENAPTEAQEGNYLIKSFTGEEYNENKSEKIPVLSNENYTVTVINEPSLLAAGEKTYESDVYGTYTVSIEKLSTQTFEYNEKTYTITLGENDTATLSIDGTEYSVTTAVENETLVLTQTEQGIETTDLYQVSLSGNYFLIAEPNASLPESDGVSLKTYNRMEDTGYIFVQSGGSYGFSDGTNDIIAVGFGYVDSSYYMVVGETTYYVSFASGMVLYSEAKGLVPSCAEVNVDDYMEKSVYRITSDTLTFFNRNDFTYSHGETESGKYKWNETGDNLILYTESASQSSEVYVYRIDNGSPIIEKTE